MFLAPVIHIISPTKVRAWNSGQCAQLHGHIYIWMFCLFVVSFFKSRTHPHSTIDAEVLCLAASKELCVQRILFKCPLHVSNLTLLDRPLSVAATVASSAALSSSKRARTATGMSHYGALYMQFNIPHNIADASNTSLSPARGKKSKKNAKTRVHEPAEDDEDECTFVPGV